eukprot:TRINITY_DN6302_c0_g1_i1.p1 TRINITY_DN6302_c0_g1~~TRINITY_DN6302_c0_g1_i1.p1  ORF type:complete len:250 (-),score=56.10 TRINITY_DN6302_c0_g1_i1:159-854(-)
MLLNLSCLLLLSSLSMSAGQDWAETGYNNSCLYEKEGLNRDGPQEFDCPKFVIESTDQIWNMYRDFDKVESYLRQYMVDDWESISVMGEYVRGMDELIRLVNITLLAFPDIQLHIVDTFCEGNDIDGYKTTMPVIHTATHLGYHPVFGSPTGKIATWYGVPNCFIKNIDGQWKYTSEINMPDSLSLYSQLGATPPPETWVMPTDDCNQLFDWDTGYINPSLVPFQMRRDLP